MAPQTAKKPAPAKKSPVRQSAEDAVDAPEAGEEAATPGTLRLKALVDRVAASTGGKKKGLKETIEATLKELGLALQNGEMLNLPQLGKVRVAKSEGATPGSAMTLKLRRNGNAPKKKPAEEALAEPS
jgi:DNA-binding protein HU-beta/DNA-binding protein HU-alpha